MSVVVCTWNRATLLARTLSAMVALDPPGPVGSSWELVVVDNGCSDGTRDVLRGFADRLPLRVVREPVLGVSRARNRGARSARGELLLFTDDDTLVDRGWLRAYVQAAARWPDAAYFGGPVAPLFECEPPRWLRDNREALQPMLCCVEPRAERRIGAEEQPFGPNMAFRRSALADARFDERVGRRGHDQLRGSDVSIVNMLKARGLHGVWIPSATVQHLVPRERATLRYLWQYHEGAGATAVRLAPERACAASPAPQICKGAAATALKWLARRPDWVVHLGRTAHYLGLRRELARQRGPAARAA